MRPGRFYSLLSGVLFLAFCAYLGAALYSRGTEPQSFIAERAELTHTVALRGIVIRTEQSCGCSATVPDASRVAKGEVFGLDSDGKALTAPCAATLLTQSDGLEYLTPELLDSLDVAGLSALLAVPTHSEATPRLVTRHAWYYAALADADAELSVGKSRVLEFDGLDRPLDAELISVSAPENGSRMLVFRLTAGDPPCLRLRQVSAKLVTGKQTGLLIPRAAVSERDGRNFVNMIAAGAEIRAEVDIIYSDADICLVAEAGDGVLRAGSRVTKYREADTERR